MEFIYDFFLTLGYQICVDRALTLGNINTKYQDIQVNFFFNFYGIFRVLLGTFNL